eukprot:CAMPEP_0194337112 /NCGR_PEP_ID=MMETSP0171-20130528/75240_1 /TAXON_ID=218684 /ORGANISM="Corethron pennatum, Strain L29A3" /LENGTH=216 /DNA_ID=CAMNT_0039100773 /DNA_START=14 /DNA_END=664 /DNA_ORIENTATION=-
MSARASFLTQLSVLITPLISISARQPPGGGVWAGCALALAGLTLLSLEGGDAATGIAALSFRGGDLLVLGGALCWSMYIFRLSKMSGRYPALSLQAVKTVLLAGLYSSWCAASACGRYLDGGWSGVAHLWLGWKSLRVLGILIFSAVGPGALADVLQQRGQKHLSASEANVILCGEPVFTAIMGYLLHGEVTSSRENVGGGLIILAAVMVSFAGST